MDYGSGGDALGGLFVGLWTSMMCLGWVVPMLIAVVAVVVWVVVLIDVLQRDPADFPNARAGRPDPNERLIWLFVVLLTGSIGAVIYYVMVMKPYPRTRPVAPAAPAQPSAPAKPLSGDAAGEPTDTE